LHKITDHLLHFAEKIFIQGEFIVILQHGKSPVMKYFKISSLLVIASLMLISSCSKEKHPTCGFNPDTVTISHSVKGWELYSWQEQEVRWYSLIESTDRTKSLSEVTTNFLRVPGEINLEQLLGRFPKGEIITLLGPGWLSNCWKSSYGNLSLPPEEEIARIVACCDRQVLVFQLTR
jgi:hypothetical protein